MNKRQAQQLTKRIRQHVADLSDLVIEAFDGKIWQPMGYDSWDAYCRAEFETAYIRLPREERIITVAHMKDSGMSNRAIASALGVDEGTVRNDLRPTAENSAPDTDGESDDDFVARLRAESDALKRNGFRIPATIEEADVVATKLVDDMRRLERLRFEIAFAAVANLPKGYVRDVREVGLYFRWMRTLAAWGVDDGLSIEQVADAMGTSVEMVEDYLSAPTGSNDVWFAESFAPPGNPTTT